jgi:hypothetical protein
MNRTYQSVKNHYYRQFRNENPSYFEFNKEKQNIIFKQNQKNGKSLKLGEHIHFELLNDWLENNHEFSPELH